MASAKRYAHCKQALRGHSHRDFTSASATKLCTINFNGTIHIRQQQTSKNKVKIHSVNFRVELLNYDLITMLFKILTIETKQEKGIATIITRLYYDYSNITVDVQCCCI